MRLADRDGVDGLSMRRLAGVLDAGAMSLYHYVASKEELLDAMIDTVFEEIALPAARDDWQSAMRVRCRSAREVLTRHPWAIPHMESRTSPGPANQRHHEAVMACLREAGFTVTLATHANWLIDSHLYGFALQQASLPFENTDGLAAVTEESYLPRLPADQYPYLSEAAQTLVSTGYDPAAEFDFGLDLILAGLEVLRGGSRGR
jgi:AcrR family transcriptional regulator